MQYSFFVKGLPVAASTDQLMEEYESSPNTYNKWSNTKAKKSKFKHTEAVLQRCSYKKMFWNMQQIDRRTPMLQCDFHVDAKGYF